MVAVSDRSELSRGAKLLCSSETFFRAFLWLLVAYSFAVWAVALLEWFRHPLASSPWPAFDGSPVFRAFAIFVGAPVTAILGGLILRRQKSNIAGLLIMAWVGGWASWGISVATETVLYLLVSLPVAAWWMSLIFLPFYFPDGRAYPRWLSPIFPAIMMLALIWGSSNVLAPANLDTVGQPANPFFVTGAQVISQFLGTIFSLLMLPLIVGVFASPLLRYRRADFAQRQQIKWFAYWSMIIFTPYLVFYITVVSTYPYPSAAPPLLAFLLSAFVGLIGLFPPIIIAVAILRHRLYDIDVIIRKTLVYGVLTAVLTLIYFGSIILLQSLVGRAVDEQSPIIIVISTLLIAALFTPVQRRSQRFIDRRFYRAKYDAQQVLEKFTQRARDEVELEALTAELVRVVEETLRPEQVQLWLRPKEGSR